MAHGTFGRAVRDRPSGELSKRASYRKTLFRVPALKETLERQKLAHLGPYYSEKAVVALAGDRSPRQHPRVPRGPHCFVSRSFAVESPDPFRTRHALKG